MSDTLIKHPRLLLSEVRGGDFAHAGDRDSIDLVLNVIGEIKGDKWLHNKTILDAGSGFGGTADYIQKNANSKVYGVDIDVEAIQHCKSKYKNCHFSNGDLRDIDFIFPKRNFDAVFLFNVIYSIENKFDFLEKIRKILKTGGVLAIFDYCLIDNNPTDSINDFSFGKIQPIAINKLIKQLPELGFKILVTRDLTKLFETWYQESVFQLKSNKTKYEARYAKEVVEQVTFTFELLLKEIQARKIGGVFLLLG